MTTLILAVVAVVVIVVVVCVVWREAKAGPHGGES